MGRRRGVVDTLAACGLDDLGGFISGVPCEQVGGGIFKIDVGVFAELLQIGQHGVGGEIALLHIGGHGLHGDGLQGLGNVGIQLPGGQRDGVDVLDGHGDRRVPLVGQAAGQHLIEHYAGGVDVAAGVDAAASGLLRRDIVDRAQRLLSQGRLRGGGQPGNAEVRHLDAAVPEHHNVLGLDVPMDDASAVGMGQRLHDLGDEVQGLLPAQRLPLFLHILLECDAVQQLHDDIFQIGGFAHVIYRHDIGVGEHRHGL